MERIIKRVIRNRSNGQLLVIVPKSSQLKENDYVELIKIPEPTPSDDGYKFEGVSDGTKKE